MMNSDGQQCNQYQRTEPSNPGYSIEQVQNCGGVKQSSPLVK